MARKKEGTWSNMITCDNCIQWTFYSIVRVYESFIVFVCDCGYWIGYHIIHIIGCCASTLTI